MWSLFQPKGIYAAILPNRVDLVYDMCYIHTRYNMHERLTKEWRTRITVWQQTMGFLPGYWLTNLTYTLIGPKGTARWRMLSGSRLFQNQIAKTGGALSERGIQERANVKQCCSQRGEVNDRNRQRRWISLKSNIFGFVSSFCDL